MKFQDCCQKGCLKMWLLVTQLLITVIYMVYFCRLIFSYDSTFQSMRKHFPDETSVTMGVGIIFAVAVYLVINTFCGCCVAWQAERCFYMTFFICTLLCMVFVLISGLYSIIKHHYYPIGIFIYIAISAFSLFLAHRIRNMPVDPHYKTLIEEMIDQEAEELYSYRGAQSQEEEHEIKQRLQSLQEVKHRNTLEQSIKKKEAGFFDFRRETVNLEHYTSGHQSGEV